jgi:PAS domain S-box-containing protein
MPATTSSPALPPPEPPVAGLGDSADPGQILRYGLLRQPSSPWLVLLLSLCVTLWSWHFTSGQVAERQELRFRAEAERIEQAIVERMRVYENSLQGAAGLIAARGAVNRETWHRYVQSLQLPTRYPGARGLGFSARIPVSEKEAWVERMHADGSPDFAVRPESERPEYHAILYLEPLDERNLRAVGYDMYSDPVRRAAMSRVRDTGQAGISGKVKLVQEVAEDVQAGFLMYLPVYRNKDPGDVEGRRVALLGFVFCPFRIGDLMRGILGPRGSFLDFRIYDGTDVRPETLMYDAGRENGYSADWLGAHTSQLRRVLEIGGHQWTLHLAALPAFADSDDRRTPWVAVSVGLLISALLFLLTWMFAHARTGALAVANAMTEELRESREQHQAVMDTASDAIVSADEAGRIIYFNRAAESLLGYRAGEMLDRPLAQVVPERLRRTQTFGFEPSASGDRFPATGKTVEMPVLAKSGEEIPVEISLAAWSTGRGRFCTAILRDIRERKRGESALQKKHEELLQASQAKDRFLASMSHELRTPLNAVIGYTGTLLMRLPGPLTPDQERQLNTVQDSAKHLLSLINDLLDVAKIDAGKVDLHIEDAEAQSVVRDIATTLQPLADAKGLALHVELPEQPILLRTDRRVLSQILLNLAGNAIKFTDQGMVRLRLHSHVANGQRLTEFSVEDSGVGIRLEDQKLLFQAYSRLDSDRPRGREGTGLGLYLSRKLADLLGAAFDVRSEYGKGSTFTLVLYAPVDSHAEGIRRGGQGDVA